MQLSERQFTAADGTELFVRHFSPASAQAMRHLVIVHGASEHGGRYEHVAGEFTRREWNVIVVDLRGHGLSGGTRTHVSRFHRYVTDVEMVLDEFELPSAQTALLGHSMGGLISIRFAQTFAHRVSCLVAVSPLLGVKVPIPRTTLAVGKMLSLVAPRWRFRSRIRPEDTTRSPEAVERRLRDPLIHRSVTAGWFFQMRRAVRAAWREAENLSLPLLVLQAGEDRIVDSEVVEPWVLSTGGSDATYHCLPDSLHELLNEPEWRSTASIIADWLHERVEASPIAIEGITAA